MKKIPYTRLYHTDFMAYTNGLTDAQIGKLIKNLCKRGMGFPTQKMSEDLKEIFELFAEKQNECFQKYERHIVKSQKGGASTGQAVKKHRAKQPEPEPEPLVLDKKEDKSSSQSNTNNPPFNSPPKGGVIKPDDVSEQVWVDFIAHRKRIKANVTITAIKRIRSEAAKNYVTLEHALETCVSMGWRGYKAEWDKDAIAEHIPTWEEREASKKAREKLQ